MNATGKRRLLKLADLLDTVPIEHFDMSEFAHEIEDGQPKCGTAACAAGWAATIPSFRRAGYRLQWLGAHHRWATPAFGDETGFDALRAFFGTGDYETCVLFDDFDPETGERQSDDPREAAQRIRKFVASEEARAA